MTNRTIDGHEDCAGFFSRVVYAIQIVMLGVLVIVLVANFFDWAVTGAHAIQLTQQLDYGEGVIWQQALMILRGDGYSDITERPMIVFHYPPLYHLVAGMLASAFDISFLVSGRLVSVLSTFGAAMVAGDLVFRAVRAREDRLTSALCGLVTALGLFTFYPVSFWSVLARVDMAALFLGYLGVWFAMRAPERPYYTVIGALFFVLAMFTKQTSIAAPLAMLATLMVIRPRLAVVAALSGSVAGLTIAAAMELVTSGGFLTHTVLYNINRIDVARTSIFVKFLGFNIFCIIILFYMIIGRKVLFGERCGLVKICSDVVSMDIYRRTCLFSFVYFIISTLMLVLVIKVGSNMNYLIEWIFVSSIIVGIGLRQPIKFTLSLVGIGSMPFANGGEWHQNRKQLLYFFLIAGLLAHAKSTLTPSAVVYAHVGPKSQSQEVLRSVRAAVKPVISDDMVIVLQAGKEVVWEAAIFAELAALGRWDEGPFIEMIRSKKFAFFVTRGDEGDVTFDTRYGGALLDAIKQSYPRKEVLGAYVLHFPQE